MVSAATQELEHRAHGQRRAPRLEERVRGQQQNLHATGSGAGPGVLVLRFTASISASFRWSGQPRPRQRARPFLRARRRGLLRAGWGEMRRQHPVGHVLGNSACGSDLPPSTENILLTPPAARWSKTRGRSARASGPPLLFSLEGQPSPLIAHNVPRVELPSRPIRRCHSLNRTTIGQNALQGAVVGDMGGVETVAGIRGVRVVTAEGGGQSEAAEVSGAEIVALDQRHSRASGVSAQVAMHGYPGFHEPRATGPPRGRAWTRQDRPLLRPARARDTRGGAANAGAR